MEPKTGTVTKIVGTTSVVDVEGSELHCDLRAKLFRREKVRLAVGDRVEVGGELGEAEGRGVIEAVAPRRNELRRARDLKRDQVLVANVDRVFLVFAAMEPAYKRAFIDRLLVGCERDEIEPFLVFNKADLASEEYRDLVAEDAQVYARLGYGTLLTSAESGLGMDELAAAFRGRVSAVIGQSGVGKSTLLNRICPGLTLRVGEVSLDREGRGKHTTTAAELVRIPGGGFVVDTPGVRGFALTDVDAVEVSDGFREVVELAPECRFNDCTHREEPGCAVRAASEDGRVDEERYRSFLRLREEVQQTGSTRQATRRR